MGGGEHPSEEGGRRERLLRAEARWEGGAGGKALGSRSRGQGSGETEAKGKGGYGQRLWRASCRAVWTWPPIKWSPETSGFHRPFIFLKA